MLWDQRGRLEEGKVCKTKGTKSGCPIKSLETRTPEGENFGTHVQGKDRLGEGEVKQIGISATIECVIQDLKKLRQKHVWSWDIIIVAGLALLFFWLQVRYLHLAAYPKTDEGIYAEAGAMMMRGLRPYEDFPLSHMPLLPFLIGIGLKLFHGMYPLRLLYLAMNCIAILPLYAVMQKIITDKFAGIIAIFFYLTFYEMVNHDFRFLAIRQTANALFIIYLWLIVAGKPTKLNMLSQCIIAALSTLLFLPAAINIAIVSTVVSWNASEFHRKHAYEQSILIYTGIGVTFILASILLPGLVQESIVSQLGRDGSDRLTRIGLMALTTWDISFLLMAITGIVIGCQQKKSSIIACALGFIIFVTIFLPESYYPHYLSLAGPALAIGAFFLLAWVLKFLEYKFFIILPFAVGLTVWHLLQAMPSLLKEWKYNPNSDYHALVAILQKSHAPLLTLEPIYAVESGLSITEDVIEDAFRMPWKPQNFTNQGTKNMSEEACTILLEAKARLYFPIETQKEWLRKYPVLLHNSSGTVLWTENSFCEKN